MIDEDLEGEQWKTVPGSEVLASNMGRVCFRNKKTFGECNGGRAYKFFGTNPVHIYVALAWVKGFQNDKESVIHHQDGDKLNNKPDNLVVMDISDHVALHKRGKKHGRRGEIVAGAEADHAGVTGEAPQLVGREKWVPITQEMLRMCQYRGGFWGGPVTKKGV